MSRTPIPTLSFLRKQESIFPELRTGNGQQISNRETREPREKIVSRQGAKAAKEESTHRELRTLFQPATDYRPLFLARR